MVLVAVGVVSPITAQPNPDTTIQLDLPDPVPLERLLDFASQRLDLNIIYDPEKVRGQQVSIKSPAQVPADTLRDLIDEVLRSRGLVLAEDDRAGWYRVVSIDELAQAARIADGDNEQRGGVLTQVFLLDGLSAQAASELVTPFLTPSAGKVSANASTGLLLVTDYAANVRRIESLLEAIRGAAGPQVREYYNVQHLAAEDLSLMLLQALGAGDDIEAAPTVGVVVDEPANRVLLLGGEAQVRAALALAESIDVDSGLMPRVYRFRYTSADRFETQMRRMLDASVSSPSYESSVDTASGVMILTAPDSVHRRVESLREQLDVATDDQASPVRFYKVKNANAADILETIRGLEDDGSAADRLLIEGAEGAVGAILPLGRELGDVPPGNSEINREVVGLRGEGADGEGSQRPKAVRTPNATLTADENTNSIIVVAAPATQAIYAKLIEELDRRRAQVMIEVTMITLDTTDNFSLGVDILAGDQNGENQSFVFNRFGLNEIGADGRLDLAPALGFNGVVLSADIADVIVQALKSDGNTRVASAPRILVNDNETGSIASVLGQPVASINQGQNSDTVTFEGFVEAGTSIEMTPHIAEGDHLRLEFSVALESFSGDAASTNLPPPRQSNTVESHVTLPDGSTIVVGGINFDSYSETIQRVPLLGEIPVLEYLFSSRTIMESQNTLFVFMRPVILRQDDFSDLRFYSRESRELAGLALDEPLDASGHPVSEPRWVW
ncbi:secretin N-terminal domain-containing protein [Algisphaera agarilytica]|uniref:General secretion pathway protein D n=1 Tax=Algisphaera agarilytica TaxID=1385975 RepID=A0A7X0H5B1_9BACT|nr:secretin N-terminal domain-containing protein [Algisphaera agarilytica]MBB6429514.1 general secretion pathway protein D [Algisphaera agarilytica]